MGDGTLCHCSSRAPEVPVLLTQLSDYSLFQIQFWLRPLDVEWLFSVWGPKRTSHIYSQVSLEGLSLECLLSPLLANSYKSLLGQQPGQLKLALCLLPPPMALAQDSWLFSLCPPRLKSPPSQGLLRSSL